MGLLAIVTAWFVDYIYPPIDGLRRFNWFERLARWFSRQTRDYGWLDGPLGVVLMLLPIAAATVLAADWLGRIAAILHFVFAAGVLLYCLGPHRLDTQVNAYLDARAADDGAAATVAAAAILAAAPPADPVLRDQAVAEAALVAVNDRVLAVTFWFFVLGPLGALLFRLSHVMAVLPGGNDWPGVGFADAGRRLYGVLAWVPARLTAWAYALAGNFAHARRNWQLRARDWIDNWVAGNDGVVAAAGVGALDPEDLTDDGANTIRAAMDLIQRTTWLWLAVIALLSLAGWGMR